MSVLAELDSSLEALRALKAPGVTKSRIASITALCLENVKSESVLVQKIFTHFKRTPGTHKLGVLYVIDSVTRQWIERAGVSGQDISSVNSPDGTFAAGVRRVTELLPVLMNDLIQTAPDDQKDKITKLIDIWERGTIFPTTMLSEFKAKLNARPPKPTATSPASDTVSQQPRLDMQAVTQLPQPNASVAQSFTGQYVTNGVSSGFQQTTAPPTLTSVLNGLAQQQPQMPSIPPIPTVPIMPPAPQPVSQPSITPAQASALAAVIPPHIASNPEALNQHLKVLQQLAEMRVPPEQWPGIVQALHDQQAAAQAATISAGVYPPAVGSRAQPRSRSRSPARRRDSPLYDRYENGRNYRERSPMRPGSASMQDDQSMFNASKWTEFDATLPQGSIKVLSRTLFAGGVACNDSELRQIFSRFGRVQTCIVNQEKRHAFVKMCTRAEAVEAKAGMQNIRDNDILSKVRSTRWGVGFGPRDCSDYSTGVSVIPIDRLTDADLKWVSSAEYGGTGGKPLATGLVMEEPDIEIGAGVSSKAISARRGEKDSRRGGGSFRGSTDNSPANRAQQGRPRNNEPRQDFNQDMPNRSIMASFPQHQQQPQYAIGAGMGAASMMPAGFGFPTTGGFLPPGVGQGPGGMGS